MYSGKKKVFAGLSAGLLLFGQGLVWAEETSSSPLASSSSVLVDVAGTVPSSVLVGEVGGSVTSRASSSSQESSVQTETELSQDLTEGTVSNQSPAVQPSAGASTETGSTGSSSSTPSSSSSSDQRLSVVKVSEISAKNYSSLAGTWKNAFGVTLFVTKEGQVYTKGANGGFLTLEGLDKAKSSDCLAITLKSQPNQEPAGHLYLVPQGQAFVGLGQKDFKDESDRTKDRFLLSGDFGKDWLSQVFYRTSTKLEFDVEVVTETSSTTGSESREASSSVASQTETETSSQASAGDLDEASRQEQVPSSSSASHPASRPSGVATSNQAESSATELTDLGGQEEVLVAGPRTRTVTRRILPSTGEKLGLLLPILGVISFITVAIIRKKKDKEDKR